MSRRDTSAAGTSLERAERARPLPDSPYGGFKRRKDRFHGWWDGRLGRPDVESDDLKTAYWRGLENLALKMYQQERVAFQEEFGPALRRAAAAKTEFQQCRDALPGLHRVVEVAEAELNDEKLRQDKLRESRGDATPDDVLARSRALRRHRDELEQASGAFQAVRQRGDLLEIEIKELEVRIRLGMERAQARADLAWRHVSERINVYRQSLCRSHEYGDDIDARLGDMAAPPAFTGGSPDDPAHAPSNRS
ncbi:hypothetical protein [Catellatospora sp. NPDC049609]|uniref:hypothetical protein n=1 Tax=Catellatospora sp. NPDC049609 TaxID=3155505 RepID=UPI003427512B